MLYKESSFVNLCVLPAALSASEGRRKKQGLQGLPSVSHVNYSRQKYSQAEKGSSQVVSRWSAHIITHRAGCASPNWERGCLPRAPTWSQSLWVPMEQSHSLNSISRQSHLFLKVFAFFSPSQNDLVSSSCPSACRYQLIQNPTLIG